MKRYISLFCIALVLVMCMVSPVSASETVDNYRFNVLDLCTLNDEGNQCYLQAGENELTFNYNYRSIIYGIDIVCKFYVQPNAVYFVNYAGVRYSLTILPLGDDLYRVYGNFGSSDNTNITLVIDTPSFSYVDFYSFYVSTVNSSFFDSDCYCAIGTVDYDATIHYVSTDDINYRSFTGYSDYLLANYNLQIYNLNWRKYDYIDYLVYCCVDSISTVTCMMGGVTVPFELSYIQNDAMTAHDFLFSVRVDCRGLDRTSSDYPVVYVDGNVITDSANMIAIMSCNGVIDISLNVEYTLLQRIINSITSGFTSLENSLYTYFGYISHWIDNQTTAIVNAINGDTTPGDSFQNEVSEKDQQLDDMAAVMDSVDQPDLDSVNVSAESYVDGNVLASSMSGLTTVIGGPVFLDVIMMSLMMATAGYVLFGKR